MKRISIIIIGLLLLSSSTLIGVASAAPPSGLTSTTLGRISLGPYHETSPDFKIFSANPTDTVVLTTTIGLGGSTGWHSHPGPAFIVVTQGTLTVYDGNDPTCTPHRYGPGTGFLDPGLGHVHIARNEGTTPVSSSRPTSTSHTEARHGSTRPPRQLPVLDDNPRKPAECRPPPHHSTHGPSQAGGHAA